MNGTPARRLDSIDMLRGLVMVIMALDHVRDMVTVPPPGLMDFAAVGAPLFFTRWITHLCAPTFMVLAGIERFVVEFWRVNAEIALGLTAAQWIGLAFVVVGLAGIARVYRSSPAPQPAG